MSNPLLHIEHTGYRYPGSKWTLHDISLTFSSGELVGIIGPNGSGKSTLLKLAAGLISPTSGSVLLNHRSIRTLSRRTIARKLGYLPQQTTSAFDYRVEEIVAMGRFCHLSGAGFLKARDCRVIDRCLEQTETRPFRHRRLSQLSGGERQRVFLASVLTQEPKILLLDEPTTGLDLHHQVTFFSLLSSLAQQNMAIIVVTHELNLAAQFCRQLVLLHNGRMTIHGPVPEVIRQDILSDIYQQSVYIGPHPLGRHPIVLPRIPDSPQFHREDATS